MEKRSNFHWPILLLQITKVTQCAARDQQEEDLDRFSGPNRSLPSELLKSASKLRLEYYCQQRQVVPSSKNIHQQWKGGKQTILKAERGLKGND